MAKQKIYPWLLASTLTVLASASHAEITVSGFASAGLISGDIKNSFLSGSDIITESAQFGADNTLGVQVAADINDRVNVSTLLLSKGTVDAYAATAQWAYISYEISEQLSSRFGRLSFPGTLYSEVQEIGFSYPWIRNPIEVYTVLPLATYSGTDLIYRFDNSENIEWMLQGFLGSAPGFDVLGGNIEVERAYGASLIGAFESGKLNFTVAGAEGIDYSQSIGSGTLNLNVDMAFASAGIEMERNNVLFIAEVIKKDIVNNPSSSLVSLQDMLAYYVTLAYRMGNFLPHFTYADTQSPHKPLILAAGTPLPGPAPQGIPQQYWVAQNDMLIPGNTELFLQKSYTAGVRYDFNSQTDFKVEVQRIIPDEGSWGVFFSDPGDHADLISLAVDVVF